MHSNPIPFGSNSAGRLVAIDEVPHGPRCGYTCPGCGEALVSVQEEPQSWRFAHASRIACAAAYESALRLAVKQAIVDEKILPLLQCTVVCHGRLEQAFHARGAGRTGLIVYYSGPIEMADEIGVLMPESEFCEIPAKVTEFDRVVLDKG